MMKEEAKATQAADELLGLYLKYGDKDYIGEPVSQLEHMCQCAQLAIEAGGDDELVLAAFFHDIGHLLGFEEGARKMEGLGVLDHEHYGAKYLRELGFSEKISKLVEGHVSAKRYLTYSSVDYFNALSTSSKQTLELQGGPMTEEEARRFESDSLFEKHIQLRKWDDFAKQPDQPLPSMGIFRDLIVRHISSENLQV